MREVKSNASNWVNKQRFLKHRFEWQEGYGAFSYSKSQVDAVMNYVLNQESHHKKRHFRDEYEDMLQKFEVEYDEKFIFTDPI